MHVATLRYRIWEIHTKLIYEVRISMVWEILKLARLSLLRDESRGCPSGVPRLHGVHM